VYVKRQKIILSDAINEYELEDLGPTSKKGKKKKGEMTKNKRRRSRHVKGMGSMGVRVGIVRSWEVG